MLSDHFAVVFQREMPLSKKCFSAFGRSRLNASAPATVKKGSFFPRDNQHRWLMRPKVLVPLIVQGKIRSVVMEQIELDRFRSGRAIRN